MSLPRILITGATGFIGAHVVDQALEAGYPVRITCRPPKLESMQKKYKGKVEIIVVAEIGTNDLSEAVDGVGAIIHCAAGMPSTQDVQAMIKSSIDGTRNLLKQAVIAKVPRVVITSSYVTVVHSFDDTSILLRNKVYTDKDWNTATKEQLLDGTHDNNWNYTAVKTIAEQETWKFAEEHPEIDITTINPPFVYGPFSPGTEIVKGDIAALSTNGAFFHFVLNNQKLSALQTLIPPQTIDVRDVAKAHILALSSPQTQTQTLTHTHTSHPKSQTHTRMDKKRILICGPTFFWKDAVECLYETRPELRERLSDASEAVRSDAATLDNERAKEVLGLMEFRDWRDTVMDAADSLMEVMKMWN